MTRLSERFHVGKKLGSGGAGHVYPARDRATGEVVAIKMIRNVDHDDPNFVDRFKREGSIHQELRGRHILQVHEHGAWEEGLAIIMELADGPSLASAIDAVKAEGRRPFEVLYPLLDQAMSGIAEVHGVDVIHRDLKPENILTSVERGYLVAKIADFGLARNVDNSMTRTNTAMGTPCYASPEQFRDAKSVDKRTDIYSFGVMLYQLLTGRRPYDGDSFLSVGNACVNGDWQLPRSLDPALPPAADDLIEAAMALEPDDRFATVQALQAAARSLAAELGVNLAARVAADIAPGPPVEFGEDKGPPPPPEKPSKVSTTSKVAVAAGGGMMLMGGGLLALLALGLGGAWMAGLFEDDPDPKPKPVVTQVDKPDEGKVPDGVAALKPPGPDDPDEVPAKDPVPKDPNTTPKDPVPKDPDTTPKKDEVVTDGGKEDVKVQPPKAARLASLKATPDTTSLEEGKKTTVRISAKGDDGKPLSGVSLDARADGGTVGRVVDLGGGSYSLSATAGSPGTMSVTVAADGVTATAWIKVTATQVVTPSVSKVSVRFTCAGCSSDMAIADSTGSVTSSASTGTTWNVAPGNVTVTYGGVPQSVYVPSAGKVKCNPYGCTFVN